MKKFLFLAAAFCFALNSKSQQNFWKPILEKDINPVGVRQIIPQKYLTFHLSGTALKDKLWSAPNEKSVKINESNCIIYLPIANGQIQAFKVVESSIMEKALADNFPNIKTFSIRGVDDVYANGKIDWNEFGFHGMIRSVNGDIFIDPFSNGNISDYISYYTTDFVKDPANKLPEAGLLNENQDNKTDGPKKKQNIQENTNTKVAAACVGVNLRTYRLALACTGEYAVAATGLPAPTVAQTLAKIVTSVNRVDGVYETEVAVRLVLVATETMVVFTNAGTDPFTGNNNAGVLINESQTVNNANIGSANYDIGHTFSTGGGGLAFLGCVCSGTNKAKGITGSPSPVGDPYDIDYVAHEMGHQFGGNHSFNSITSNCGGGNRNAATSMEPGSGITIMGYAGICGADNLASNSIAYFHGVNYDEIVNFTNLGGGNACAVTTTSGNNPPVVTGSATYNVPKSTPFYLTGSATDPDGDPLIFQWEEMDAGAAGGTWNSGNKPYFMSYTPTPSPTRSFPKLSVILTGNLTGTKGEYCPATAQTLKFRITARDNKLGGGGVCSATSSVVITAAGPFNVTYPNAAGVSWPGASTQTVTWNVNATDLAPVSCTTVNVLISYNTGTTFTMLMANVANTGSLVISVPSVTANISTCRIKVECPGNIFFDINDNNFTITTVLGINKLACNPIGVFISPNPFYGFIRVDAGNLDAFGESKISITDLLGKTVFQETSLGYSINKDYNLDYLENGVYFITLKNNSRQTTTKIIKQ